MATPTCECISALPQGEKLNAIYCVLTSILSGGGGVTVAQLVTLGALNYGEMRDYAGTTAPTGWLLADGSAVSRTTYASLFAVVGTTYGAGNGTTTFNIPDMRGRVSAMPPGASLRLSTDFSNSGGMTSVALGGTGGEQGHLLTSGEISGNTRTAPDGVDFFTYDSESEGNPHNNVQPTLLLNKIIFTGV
jgi:microcystin-dependent protein